MSLDDKLDSEIVECVVKSLDTTLSLARRILDDQYSFSDECFSHARAYQKELNH